LIDSTGLQVYGAGQWLEAKHGAKSRRTWRKLHLAVDAANGMIAAHDDEIEVVIPPRTTAVLSGEPGLLTQRDRHLAMITEQGRVAW
jgi:hypothetical protein